jgi:hypothetical protein
MSWEAVGSLSVVINDGILFEYQVLLNGKYKGLKNRNP